MPVYTVHAPAATSFAARNATDRYVFVRDGFHVWAFVFGPLWLIWHRLWLALLGFIAVSIVLAVTLGLLQAGGGTRFIAMLVLALLLGLEAGSLRRWTLARRKWHLLDIVVADNEEAAERRFFDRWAGNNAMSGDRGTPARDPRAYAGLVSPQRDVIGLFPQPGAPR